MRTKKEKRLISLLNISNLILISSALMLIMSLIIFNLYGWSYIKGTSVLLWCNLMFLIMSLSYTFYFKFQTSHENWMRIPEEDESEEETEMDSLKVLTHIDTENRNLDVEILTDNPQKYIEEVNKQRELDGKRMYDLEEEFLVDEVNVKLY